MTISITSEDVYSLTSTTVDAEQIRQATAIVEMFAQRSFTEVGITDRDTFWVRRAIAYQAAWITAQADLFERVDVQSLAYDQATITPRDENSFVLAPMARMALGNCTWSNGSASGRRVGMLNIAKNWDRGTYYDIYTKTEYDR